MASKLTTLNGVLETQIATTSIEVVQFGYSQGAAGKLTAECTWGGGDNTPFGNNVQNRFVDLIVMITGATFDQVDVAVEEVMVLFQDTTAAPFVALSGAGVDWISPPSQSPPVTFSESHQTAAGGVKFQFRIPYSA